ncbi:hypothetical protein V8F33_000075 [Rhypophila sp. PSN 637]
MHVQKNSLVLFLVLLKPPWPRWFVSRYVIQFGGGKMLFVQLAASRPLSSPDACCRGRATIGTGEVDDHMATGEMQMGWMGWIPAFPSWVARLGRAVVSFGYPFTIRSWKHLLFVLAVSHFESRTERYCWRAAAASVVKSWQGCWALVRML